MKQWEWENQKGRIQINQKWLTRRTWLNDERKRKSWGERGREGKKGLKKFEQWKFTSGQFVFESNNGKHLLFYGSLGFFLLRPLNQHAVLFGAYLGPFASSLTARIHHSTHTFANAKYVMCSEMFDAQYKWLFVWAAVVVVYSFFHCYLLFAHSFYVWLQMANDATILRGVNSFLFIRLPFSLANTPNYASSFILSLNPLANITWTEI